MHRFSFYQVFLKAFGSDNFKFMLIKIQPDIENMIHVEKNPDIMKPDTFGNF